MGRLLRDLTSAPAHSLLVAAYPVVFLFAANTADQVTLAPLWAPLALAIAAACVALHCRTACDGRLVPRRPSRHAWPRALLQLRSRVVGSRRCAHRAPLADRRLSDHRAGRWLADLARRKLGAPDEQVPQRGAVGPGGRQRGEHREHADRQTASPSEPRGPRSRSPPREPSPRRVLPGHGSLCEAQTLSDIYGYDNGPFMDALRERGSTSPRMRGRTT